MLLFLLIFLSLYGLINYYVGLRGWQAFQRWLPSSAGIAYAVIIAALALAYLLGRFGERFLPHAIANGLTLIGAYWLGAILYFLMIAAVVDLVRLVNRYGHLLSSPPALLPLYTAFIAIVLVVGLMAYGTWNARHPRVRHYDIAIPKSGGTLNHLRIAMASDLHLGPIVDRPRLADMVDRINALSPDIVVLPGDTIDEDLGPFYAQGMPEELKRLTPRYGVYAVLGNHEYIGGNSEEHVRALENIGVIVLRDQAREVADSFNLAGRDDAGSRRFTGRPRQPLSTVVAGVNPAHPLILLDHQPSALDESRDNGVDLQLSGHTHHGQFFPNNLITRMVFEQDWGYLRKQTLQLIVSCGFGTWGPPIRIGNIPEIVDITVTFTGG